MPCISNQFDPAIGPLITVGITQPGAILLQPTSTAPAPPPLNRFTGLIDTGATLTCISPQVATTLSLRPFGKRQMASATHAVAVNVYLVDLVLIFGNTGLHRPDIEVMEFAPPAGAPFEMLVGRDVICSGLFTMSFDGRFTFAI